MKIIRVGKEKINFLFGFHRFENFENNICQNPKKNRLLLVFSRDPFCFAFLGNFTMRKTILAKKNSSFDSKLLRLLRNMKNRPI